MQSWGAYFHSTIHQEIYIYIIIIIIIYIIIYIQLYIYIIIYNTIIYIYIYNYIHTIIYIIIYIQLYIYIIYIVKYITIYKIIYTYIHYNYIHTWFRVEHGVYNHAMPGYDPRFTRSFTAASWTLLRWFWPRFRPFKGRQDPTRPVRSGGFGAHDAHAEVLWKWMKLMIFYDFMAILNGKIWW